jgi:hypothetical protein
MRAIRLTCLLLLGAAALLAPASTQAAYDPIGSGTAKLTLDKGFRAFLKEHGVKLTATKPAKLTAKAASFPAPSGEIDPTLGKGTIELEGELKFSTAKKRLTLKQIMVKTKRTPLLAKLGGGQLKIASGAQIATKRVGFGTHFQARQMKLSAKAATRLNKRLKLKDAFKEGQLIGNLLTKTEPATATVLNKGLATIVFDPQILAKLDALFVSLNPIFPAEHVGPTFTFPIILEGQVAPSGTAGTLRTGGDVELLQLGGGQVFWHEFWLDLGARVDSAEVNVQPAPPYPGKLGRVGVFDLGATPASADPGARTVTLANAPLALQAQSAATLNQAFAAGKEAFRAGEALGTISFTAQTQ